MKIYICTDQIKKASVGCSPDGQPYFSERELEVKSALDITRGTG